MLCAPRRTLGRFYVRAEGAILGGIMKVTATPQDVRGCRMASSHAARNGLPHGAAKATEATAPEATEAATAAPRRIAGTPTHGYEPTREAGMAIAESWRRE
jgi:hypothetical protein